MQDLFDNLLGHFDLIDRLAAQLRLIARRDRGVEFRILRADKGGTHAAADMRKMLAEYGIKAHRTRFDATYLYFVVGSRQADWTRYMLAAAGVATTAGQKPSAARRMPTTWSSRKERY